MTNAVNAQECLERARMHDQLAATTADASARLMHKAMAAEFRRRAEEAASGAARPITLRPMMELSSPVV